MQELQRTGFVLQHAEDQLFCPTVLDDVAFGLLNLGLTSLLNVNFILLLDVVLWTLMHLWLSHTIRKRAVCSTGEDNMK